MRERPRRVFSNTVHLSGMAEHAPEWGAPAQPPPRRWRARVLASLYSTVFVAVAFVGAELVARWRVPDYLVKTRGFHVFSDSYGWASRKGVSMVNEGGRGSVFIPDS